MSSSTAYGATDSPRDARLSAAGLRYSAVAIAVVLGIVGVILVWRRLAGALGQPLPAATMASWALILSTTVLVARWLWRRGEQRAARGRHDWFSHWVASLLLVALAAAVSVVGTSPVALAVLWCIVALEEGIAWLGRRRSVLEIDSPSSDSGRLSEPRVESGVDLEQKAEPAADDVPLAPNSSVDATVDEALIGGRITQQFVRYRSAEGNDVYSGQLRVAMPARSRATSVHVAFCPPFARVPVVELEHEGGPSGRIQPVQVLPYGARLDLRLDRAAEEEAIVVLRFSATSSEA